MRIREGTILLLLLAGLMCFPAEAGVIFSNFSGSPGWNSSVANGIPADQARGWAFTAASSENLDNIVLPISYWMTDSPGFASILLMNDLAGAPNPASVLESYYIFDSTYFGGYPATTLSSVLHPGLVQGTQYWLAVMNPLGGGSGMLDWHHNSLNLTAPGTLYIGGVWYAGGGTTVQGAMQLNGLDPGPSGVPEPASAALIISGATLLLWRRRQRERHGSYSTASPRR